jgi:S-adenosylmethionine uptake transporter
MAYYSTLFYLAAALVFSPLVVLVGDIPGAHPSIAFLFRAWSLPTFVDFIIMVSLGVVWVGWIYFNARAYSLAQASIAAPFEYVSLPINIIWGYLIWNETPSWMTLTGALMTIFSGLYILHREQKEG